MKKLLAITLSLILAVSMIVCVPMQSSASPTDANLANGDWYCCFVDYADPADSPYWTGTGYCYTQANDTITLPIKDGLTCYSMYTKIDGLKPNTKYILTFNYDKAGALDAGNTGIISNEYDSHAAIAWIDNRIDKDLNKVYGLATDDTATKTATIRFTTDATTDYILSIMPTFNYQEDIIFSNFKLVEDIVTGDSIVNGNWYCCFVDYADPAGSPYWSGTGYCYTKVDNTVTIPILDGLTCYSMYAKLDDLKPDTDYILTFNYDKAGAIDAGNTGIISNEHDSHAAIAWVDNRIDKDLNKVYGLGTDDANTKTITIKFTTDSTTDYILSIMPTFGYAEDIVLSNFNFREDVVTGETIVNGNWYCCFVDYANPADSPYWTGTGYCYTQANNTITLPIKDGLTCYSMYTTINGLEPNTKYALSFKYDQAGAIDAGNTGIISNEHDSHAAIAWVDNRIDKDLNEVHGLGTDDADSKTITIKFKTDDNPNYILSIMPTFNYQSDIILSDFEIKEDVLTGAQVAGGNWYICFHDFATPDMYPYWTGSDARDPDDPTKHQFYPQGENSFGITTADGVYLYGVYTKLDDLRPYTTYKISFNYENETDIDASNSGVILNKDNLHSSISWIDNRIDKERNTVYGLFTTDPATKTASVTFDTDHNTNYYLSLITGKAGAVNYTNFKVEATPLPINTDSPLIAGNNLEKTYCEDLYNLIDHQSFEKFSTDSSWGELPTGFSVVKDDNANTGKHVLRVEAGSKKVFEFTGSPATVYELAASVRGDATTKGSVAVVLNSDGTGYYATTEGVDASIITAPTDGKWKREAFSFPTMANGTIYVAIECTEGVMYVDNLMLFDEKYASAEDNNDYVGKLGYDYDNPNYVDQDDLDNNDSNDNDDSADNSGSADNDATDNEVPPLGDSAPVSAALVIMLVSVAVVGGTMLFKKRKEEHYAK